MGWLGRQDLNLGMAAPKTDSAIDTMQYAATVWEECTSLSRQGAVVLKPSQR